VSNRQEGNNYSYKTMERGLKAINAHAPNSLHIWWPSRSEMKSQRPFPACSMLRAIPTRTLTVESLRIASLSGSLPGPYTRELLCAAMRKPKRQNPMLQKARRHPVSQGVNR
jgi:hypothetical protein